ncbi:NlpC/P60 family [Gaiella occulta]|uniref:NlpC/P60 family n=1 Tax=Gaiella occulta TaxID=1002870 RepID=A0A7M2YW52_9ACTN|nr:C40 family peptidase [Gaiella occulta]RDI73677.1 NlpC/P60 family [Gaiella occulta]
MAHVQPSGKFRTAHVGSWAFLAAVALAGVLAALLGAAGASANPSIREKRAQAQAILQQVQELDGEVGAAAERWNGANYRLGQLSRDLRSARADLLRAQEGVKVSQARIGARLRELYVNGEPASAVEVLLGAKSLTEIVDVLDAKNRIASQDSRIARDLRSYRERVALRRQQLAKARAQQAEIVRRRAAEKAAIESKLAERKRLLASVQGEVRRLLAQERVRQAELRRQAEIRLAQEQAAAAAAARQAAAAQARANAEAGANEVAPQAAADAVPPGGAAAAPDAQIPAPPPADAGKGAQVVAIAMQYLGVKYVWGAASPSVGFDCSGLTMYVFNQVGVSLPHYAAAQYAMGVPVSKADLQPGDLVFFRGLGHMGIYIGGGNMIHAPHTGDVVKITPLSDPYYVANWVGARRVL